MEMHSSHDNLRANMADALFDEGLAHNCPRARHFDRAFFFVVMVIVHIEFEEFEACGHILSRGNQNTSLLIAANTKVFACRSCVQPRRVSVSRDCGRLQSMFDFDGRFRQADDLCWSF